MIKFTTILILLVAILLGITTWVISSSDAQESHYDEKPSEVVRAFYKTSLNGEITKSLSFWSSRNSTCVEDDRKVICPKKPISAFETISTKQSKYIFEFQEQITEVGYERIEDTKASVLISSQDIDGDITNTIYKLVKTKSKWKIYSYMSQLLEDVPKFSDSIQNVKVEGNSKSLQ